MDVTEIMETPMNRETENRRNRETDGTQERDDMPPLAACVKTLQEAVQLSLENGLTDNCLFIFARAIKAFEITVGRQLTPADLQSAFALWWSTAKPQLPPDADFDEWRFAFEDAFAKARAPLGANPLQAAIRRASLLPPPPQAARYTSPKLKRLVAVCYHLQILAGDSPFFLSVRDAARLTETKQLHAASALLGGLVRDGVLIQVSKGTPGGRRATRFRFNLPQSDPANESSATTPRPAAARNGQQEQDAPRRNVAAAKHSSTGVNAAVPRKPKTYYELVERKKALQALIKEDAGCELDREGKKRHYRLEIELHQVNSLLAGIAP